MRIGVVGLGYWGKKVAREYRDLMREGIIDEMYICDSIAENIENFKNECGECKHTSDYRELFDKVDGVHICTPNSSHFELTKEFIEHNVNVLVEKPMTIKYSNARKLAYSAYNRNLVLAVGHIFRFNNAVRKVKKLYEEEELGDIYYAKLQWTSLIPSPHERDVVYDLAPHPFDVLNYITNDWPNKIYAVGKAYRREEYEEVAYISAEYPNGVIANLEVSWMFPEKIRRVTLVGTKKTLILEAVKQEIKIYDYKEQKWEEIKVEANNTIRDEAHHFVKAIENRITPINDGFNAAENVRVLESSVKSIHEKRVVDLEW